VIHAIKARLAASGCLSVVPITTFRHHKQAEQPEWLID
jgi:hypothetical protein